MDKKEQVNISELRCMRKIYLWRILPFAEKNVKTVFQ